MQVQHHVEDKVKLQVSPEVINYLADVAYSKKLGVRYVERMISSKISQQLADKILFNKSIIKKRKTLSAKMKGENQIELL